MIANILMIPAAPFVEWLRRKLVARMQSRIGPPVLQVYWDLWKLANKESKATRKNLILNTAPLLALVTGISLLLFVPDSLIPFQYDFIVFCYLFILLDTFVLLGAFASRSPFSLQAAARELLLMLGYETTFLIVVTAFMSRFGTLSLAEFNAEFAFLSMPLASILLLITGLVILRVTPFDVVGAAPEISAGLFSEYFGIYLGIIDLAEYIRNLAFLVILVILLLGKAWIIPGVILGTLFYCAQNIFSPRYSTLKSTELLLIVAIIAFMDLFVLI
jgi:formate hydrogenlyase subunit 4